MISATRGFRVGRISGVEVRLDWSLLIVFWLIVMNLGGGLFPIRHPEWSPWLSWGMAVIAAVLFVLSILAHELSHALVGRANGVAVAGITLFIFGGVAHMRGEPQSPRAELLMTVVGPLTSLAIGLLATAGGAYLAAPAVVDAADPFSAFQRVGPFATVLLWLGPINVMIGLFNLIPGYPLDGGRVLRAALWAATRDLAKATRWAAFVGQAFGMFLIILGVSMILGVAIPWLGRGLISGLWTAFIGWFLYGAAASSSSQVMLSELLEDVPVSRLMKHQPVTIDAELSVARLVDDHFMSTAERAFPVADGDRLLGIVAMEDIRKVAREEWPTTRVRDVMTAAPELVVVTPGESAAAALTKLAHRDIEQLPVVDGGGRLLGMLRRRDILRWLELQPRGGSAARERHA
jgi:Zn-dependent protease/predicted transcriptional regulator